MRFEFFSITSHWAWDVGESPVWMSELRVVIYTAGEKVSAKQIVLLADGAYIVWHAIVMKVSEQSCQQKLRNIENRGNQTRTYKVLFACCSKMATLRWAALNATFKTCLSLLVKFPGLIGYTYRILYLTGFTFLQLKTPPNI